MAEESRLNDDLESFAAALSGLTPQAARVNRDRLMYEAGHAAALAALVPHRRSLLMWKRTAGLSTLAAACLVVLLVSPFAQQPLPVPPQQRVVQQPANGSAGADVAGSGSEVLPVLQPVSHGTQLDMSYVGQRNLALAEGIDKLPQSEDGGSYSSSATHSEMLKSLANDRDLGS